MCFCVGIDGDGWKASEEGWQYDAIHVGACAGQYIFSIPHPPIHTLTHTNTDAFSSIETLPEELVEQLRPGGRMVIPLGEHSQYLTIVDKKEDGSIVQSKQCKVRYVPLVHSSE